MIKMIHGDCLEYIKTMTDKIDVVITDPPYGIDYNPNWKKWNGSKSDFAKIENDDTEFDPTFLLKYEKLIIFGANHFCHKLPYSGWLIWDKRVKESCDKMFGRPFEMAWWSNKTYKICRLQHGGVVNADSSYGNNQKRVHPTQKPIKLMEWCIELISKEGDTIFDPFTGSGSTGIACHNLNRNFIGIEKSKEYYDIAVKRINDAGGNVIQQRLSAIETDR